MWLVVGGPLLVVLASFFTIYLAVSRPDPVYSDAQRGSALPQTVHRDDGRAELAPAVQARNHAATGGLARPAPEPVPGGAAPAR